LDRRSEIDATPFAPARFAKEAVAHE
jgi:hypothetical protein